MNIGLLKKKKNNFVFGIKLENNKDKIKKPLKLSSSGRLQIRKNLGPSSSNNKNQGNKNKTIQIVLEIKIINKKAPQLLNLIIEVLLHLERLLLLILCLRVIFLQE